MYTSQTRVEFHDLLHAIPSLCNGRLSQKDVSDALFMYLMKLRTAKSNNEIASYFKVSHDTVSKRIQLARDALKTDIVPKYVNYARSRADLHTHKTILSHKLFDENNTGPIHMILDGTYIYVEKSKSHGFQKSTYNSHKKRNYVKVMVGTAPDGLIIFTEGPFKAGENDATITVKLIRENIPALQNFQPEDVIIVDRGFRDCSSDLINNGFIVKTPACSPSNSQLTTEEANYTRLVTRVRYDIERMNGVMKNTWKSFAQVWETRLIPVLMTDFEVAAALINRSKKSLVQNQNAESIANRMLERVNLKNELSGYVASVEFKKILLKKDFNLLTDLTQFPKLTMDDLYTFSCGPYQIEQARYYANDHSNAHENNFQVFNISNVLLRTNNNHTSTKHPEGILLMTRQISRFVSGTKYRSYVLFDPAGTDFRSILEYCCECKVGRRTVGCCSHVMTIIYYLGFAHYFEGITKVAKHLDHVFDRQSCENEENIDLDE